MNKNRCDKCTGYLNYQEDFDGSFLECINCGNNINLNFNKSITQAKLSKNWGVQPHTKKFKNGYR